MNILIRDVPDEVRDALADMARLRGQSMQAYLRGLLESQARSSRNAQILERARAVGGGVVDDDEEESVGARVMREIRYGDEVPPHWTTP